MRIVHLLPAFNRGGTERIVINLAKHQISKGHHVAIFTFSATNLHQEETKQFEVFEFPDRHVNLRLFREPIHNLDSVNRKLKELNPDIIHSHSYWTDLILSAIPKHNARYISHLHLYYEEHDRRFSIKIRKLKSWIGLKLLHKAYRLRKTRFIAVSSDVKNFYKKRFPSDLANKILVLPNFLQFEPIINAKKQNNEPVGLLSVGRLVPIKNHVLLIEVIKLLVEDGIKIKLTIAGDGPERQNLLSIIAQDDLEEIVKLPGVVTEMKELYESHDIYLHSAIEEPFGLTILEAMSQGLPAVVFRCSGPQEIIRTVEEGFLVDSPVEFVSAIKSLISDRQMYERISSNGLNRSKSFDIGPYYENLMEVYSA